MTGGRVLAPWFVLALAVAATAGYAADDDLADLLAQPVFGSSRIAGASKHDQDVAETPGMVYVRTGGEIRAQGYRTLAEVLDSLPGTHSRNDRSYTYTGVRGISRPGDYSSRLLLLIDGVRINEAIYDSATGGSEFPLDVGLIDRVEYIAGPGSALYGSNAVLGVVNIITRTASQLSGLNAAIDAGSNAYRRLALTWGGDLGSARVLLGLASERAPGHRQLYFPEYDDPATNGGIAQDRDGARNDKLFAKAHWRDFTFSAELSDRLKFDPTASYGAVFNTRSVSIDRYALGNLSFARPYGQDHEVFARVGVARYIYYGYALYGASDAPVPAESRGEASWASGELRYVWSGWSGHRILLGTEFQNNFRQRLWSADVAPDPQIYTDLRLHSSRWSLFVNDEWRLTTMLRLNIGLRSDWLLNGHRTTTPRIAALWSPTTQWTFKIQHGIAFREPNASERQNPDNPQLVTPNLKVESTRSNEASALWRPAPGLDLTATLYSFAIRDSIDLVAAPTGGSQYLNVGGMKSRGAELEATQVFGNGVQARASWSKQSGTEADAHAALSDSPRSLVKVMVTAPGPWNGSRIGVNLERVGERDTLSGASLEPFVTVNTNLTYAPAGRPWTLSLGVYNLTGRRHADPAGPDFLQDSLPQDGRSWRVQLNWAL